MVKGWWTFALGVILLVGLGLRLYDLVGVPHGFFCDEADIAYNAYTLLHHGVDEYGKTLPIFFQSLDDYKDPIEIYSTVPFVGIFGLNEFASRLPAVMWGILTILAIYFFTKEIRNNNIASIAAAGAGATMPWLVHYSRIGVEYSVYVATWTWTLFFFLKAFKRKVFFFPAFILLGITLYSYQPAKLLVPLLILGWILTYHHLLWRHRKYALLGLGIFLVMANPMVLSFFDVAGTARFMAVSIFSSHLSTPEIVAKMTGNYLYMFSPGFFLTGDPTFITRHFVRGLIPLLPVTVPFLAIGLLYILFTIRKASSQLLLWLLLIYPVGAMVVASGPFSSRTFIGAPLFAVLIGIGMELVIHAGRHRVGKIVIGFVILLLLEANTIYFANFYLTQYPLYSSDYWGWQYGAGSIMQSFLKQQSSYDDFAIAGDFNAPEIFLKFYDPEKICVGCKIAAPEDIFDPKRRQLFALTPDEISKRTQFVYATKESFYYPNGQEAFRLVTLTKK